MTVRQSARISQAKILIRRYSQCELQDIIVDAMDNSMDGRIFGWRVYPVGLSSKYKIIVWARGNSQWDKHPSKVAGIEMNIPY